MDLVAVNPVFNLYDEEWPIRAALPPYPPAKFVFAQEGRRMGLALDSLVSHGCIISGGRVLRSILSPGARVDSFSEVESSILLEGSRVGRHSRIRRAIIDAGVQVPENSEIGFDPEADRKSGHFVTESGLVVVHKIRAAPFCMAKLRWDAALTA
jgi:glucose-1-phosphate adenylyltransferase